MIAGHREWQEVMALLQGAISFGALTLSQQWQEEYGDDINPDPTYRVDDIEGLSPMTVSYAHALRAREDDEEILEALVNLGAKP